MEKQKNNKGKKIIKHSTARKWALSYGIVVLLSVLVISFVLITFGVSYVHTQSRKNIKRSSENIAANIDQRLEYIKQSAIRVSMSNWAGYISSAAGADEPVETMYGITPEDISFQINSYCTAERIIKNITVFFPYANRIFTRKNDYTLETYFNSSEAFDKDFYQGIEELIKGNKYFEYQGYKRNSDKEAVIIYNFTVKGLVVAVELDSKELGNFVASLVYDNSFDFYMTFHDKMLVGKDERVITKITDKNSMQNEFREFKVDDVKLASVTVKSKGTDFRFHFIYKQNYVTSDKAIILRFVYLGAGISIVIGLLLSLLFVGKNYKPLKNMLDIARTAGKLDKEDGDEYKYLKSTFEYLGEEISRYKQDSLKYQKAVWKKLLIEIITGNFALNKENMKLLSDNDLTNHANDSYAVILFGAIDEDGFSKICRENGIENLEKYFYDLIAEYIEQDYNFSLWQDTVQIRENIYAVVLKSTEKSENNAIIASISNKLRVVFTAKFKGTLAIAEGEMRLGINGISKSYQMADKLLRWQIFTNNVSCEAVERLKRSNNRYYLYPRDWENRLLNELYKGNAEVVNNLLDEIIKENCENRELKPDMKIHLINRLLETADTALGKMDEKDFEALHKFEQEMGNMNELQLFNEIRTLYNDICIKGFENQLKLNENRLYNNIVEYIKANYADRDLSLKGVSSVFSVPEYTISKIFKKITGVNFLDFVNQERIEKAKELISQTDIVVYEIAKQVGFDNDRTFRRVFKKYLGIGPMEYRKKDNSAEQS